MFEQTTKAIERYSDVFDTEKQRYETTIQECNRNYAGEEWKKRTTEANERFNNMIAYEKQARLMYCILTQ